MMMGFPQDMIEKALSRVKPGQLGLTDLLDEIFKIQ